MIKQIDVEIEMQAVTSFIEALWNTPKDKSVLTNLVRQVMLKSTMISSNWSDDQNYLSLLSSLTYERTNFVEAVYPGFERSDGYIKMLNMLFHGRVLINKSALRSWNFERFHESLVGEILSGSNAEKLSEIFPVSYVENKSYDTLKSQYESFEDYSYRDSRRECQSRFEYEKNLFSGSLKEKSNLVENVTLHNVLKADFEDETMPWVTLIKSIIIHGLAVGERNNVLAASDMLLSINVKSEFSFEIPEIPDDQFLFLCMRYGLVKNIEQHPVPSKSEIMLLKSKYDNLNDKEKLDLLRTTEVKKQKEVSDFFLKHSGSIG